MRKINRGKIKRKTPKALKWLGILGIVASEILVGVASFKSARAIDKRKEELGVDKLSFKETVNTIWKNYILSFLVTGGTMTSLIVSDSMQDKQMAALSVAYTAAEKTISDYKTKLIEKFGEAKQEELVNEVMQSQANEALRNAPREANFFQTRNEGDTLFYEPCTGAFFYSTPEKVKRAFLNLSEQLIANDEVCLNDLFYFLKLRGTKLGNIVGWTTKRCRMVKMENGHGVYDDEDIGLNYWIICYNFMPIPLKDKKDEE